MTERAGDRLELDLAALASAVAWPPTPDVASAVRTRIVAEAPVTPARPGFRWLPLRPLGRPMLLALLLLVLVAAVAAAIGLGLPGLRISFTGDPLPTPNVPAVTTRPGPTQAAETTLPGSDLALGEALPLAAAREAVDFPIRLPVVPGRGEPDAVYIEFRGNAALVTLVWRAGPDLPPLRPGSDVGLLITQLRATLDDDLLEKVLGQGTTVERVMVGEHPAVWISGRDHVLFLRRPDGDVVDTPVRLVGDTLAVEIDGQIVRIEANGGRATAVALAETLR